MSGGLKTNSALGPPKRLVRPWQAIPGHIAALQMSLSNKLEYEEHLHRENMCTNYYLCMYIS